MGTHAEREPELQEATRTAPVPERTAPAVRRVAVGAVDDPEERAADQVAEVVMQRLANPLRRSPVPVVTGSSGRIRRSDAAAADAATSEAVGPEGGALDDATTRRIERARGGGKPMPDDVRASMEPAFGADLSRIRIHTGPEPDALNRSLGARAFTTGSDVFFRAGEFRPDTGPGRRVLAHELAHSVQQGGARSDDTTRRIQRLAYNQNPTTWGAPNVLNRRRSGEGAEGVYFVNDVGPVFAAGTVVVKPLRSSGEITFANQFLSQGMGFDTPDEVTYSKTSGEGQALQNIFTSPGVVGLKSPNEAQNQFGGANVVMVMSMVQGKSLQTLNDNEALELLRNEAALKEIGHLMVSDAFLGNQDRLVGLGQVNLGNFFYSVAGALQRGKIRTIDNDSSFQAATYTANGNLDGELSSKVFFIDQLCTANGKLLFINKFINRMKGAHANNPQTLAELNTATGWITHKISTGVDEGLTEIANVFSTNMDLVRAVGAINDPHSANKRNVDEAKGIAQYIQERQSGTDPATALNKLTTYVEYRTMRNKFPTGLKWMTKVGMKRGF